jgi:hypothetical protein
MELMKRDIPVFPVLALAAIITGWAKGTITELGVSLIILGFVTVYGVLSLVNKKMNENK